MGLLNLHVALTGSLSDALTGAPGTAPGPVSGSGLLLEDLVSFLLLEDGTSFFLLES